MRMFEAPRKVQPKPPPPTYQFMFELTDAERSMLYRLWSEEKRLRENANRGYSAIPPYDGRIKAPEMHDYMYNLLSMMFEKEPSDGWGVS